MTKENLAKILLDNISDINVGNMLKSQEHIKLKETDTDAIELADLLEAIRTECISRYHKCDDMSFYAHVVLMTYEFDKYMSEHSSVNKAHLYDRFLFDLRSISL